jgi:glycosyltransferase involved in cell wall biosynthesis
VPERSITVLYLECTGDLYGTGTSLLNMAVRLKNMGIVPIVLLPNLGPLTKKLSQYGIDYYVISNLSIIRRSIINPLIFLKFVCSVIPATLTVFRIIKRFEVDIVHTNSAVTLNGAMAAKLARIPHVWHIRENFMFFPQMLWRPFQEFIFRFSTLIVCNSEATRAQFGKNKYSQKLRVIYNGMDPNWYDSYVTTRGLFKKQLGLSDGTHLVATIGRISEIKGQEFFVEAIARLKTKLNISVKFIVVGDVYPGNEHYRESLIKRIDDLEIGGLVWLHGYVEDIRHLLCDLDILVVPTLIPEGFGNTVLEAMAASRPVIATKLGGPTEIIVDGTTGILVDPQDPNELAESILDLLRNREKRKRMGMAGRQRLIDMFDIKLMIEKILSLYDSLKEMH